MVFIYIVTGFLMLSCLFLLMYIKQQEKILSLAISDIINELVDNILPCKLISINNFSQEEDSIIFDFSHYEKEKTVVVIKRFKEEAKDINEKLIDGKAMYYPRAVVYKLGEQWLWQI